MSTTITVLDAEQYIINVDFTSSGNGFVTYTTPNTFSGVTFYNAYFNYNTADLSFTNCIFYGVCYLKNIGGTITHTNSKGGFVISNLPIPDTVIGIGDVPDANF